MAADRPRATRRGGILAYAAPAGLGKTTLLAEIRRLAGARGCTVLSARGGDQEQRVAFHVARQLLQPQLAHASDTELRERLGSWYDIVGPALGLRATGGDSPPDPQGLRDGLDWVLTHLAVRRAPLVVVLDDAHWADPESLGWLAAFAPRAEELPMLLVVAYRPDELPDEGAEFTGHRSGQRPLGLAPLTTDAIARLVRDRVGAHADDAFCRECWTVTSGNPFEAVELAAKVRDHGLEPTAGGAHELRDLAAALKGSGLVTRLERLGPATVRLAWACAVLGTEISLQLAGAVAGLGDEAVVDCVGRLREARVLAEADDPDEPLRFVHPLIATTVYRSIPAATRVALHGQAAWCVVDAGLGSTAAARHLLETHPEGDSWAVGHLRAWDATLRAEPSAVAVGHAERALEGGLSWADESRGFEVPVLVALTFLYADRPGRAEELFAAGTAEFERQGWRGAHLSFAYTLLGYIRYRRGRLVEAEDFVRAGLRLAERVGPRTPAQWYAVGVTIEVLLARGRVEEADRIAREHDFGEPFPAAVTFPDSQTVHAELLLARGRTDEAAAELAAVGRRLDPRGMRNPAWCPWQLHLAAAEAVTTPGRARRTAQEAVARARQYGAPSAIGSALRVLAEVSAPSERLKLLEESVDWLDQSPAAYELARSLVALGIALRRTERAGEAAEHLYRGLEAAQDCGADGLVDEARAELAAAGLRPRSLHPAGTDTLTARERQAAELTVRDRDVALHLGVDAAAVSRLLSAVYRKLGTDRTGLDQALRNTDRPGGQP
ncbi:ATP-binding protein [Streptomyces narbonensis]|uniref:ATP-binding protein n=1 Tax=Streptomyces narbonensis TaxID=67333 RepID=UPI001E40E9CB|nr:AAA family ATPase [Streptomyces narbonensis]